MPIVVVLCSVLALLVIATIAIGICRKPAGNALIYTACLIACAVAFASSSFALITATQSTIVLPIGLPWLGSHFRLDALAAFFLCVVNLGGAAASLYGIGYGRHETSPQRVLPFFPAFLAGMNLVVVADDAFTFLISWEFMSLVSWALVVSHDRAAENLRAGYVYILMASFGTLALLFAFALLAGTDGQYAFASMREHGLTPGRIPWVFLLALIGAGSKAGLMPLHAWLPLAHPAAPSHVSALMSGVMTKVAVYAFLRITFDLLGPLDWHLSIIVISIGALTAVMGVLHALMEDDIKRLLAYSTVENIGIIFIGIGLALAFRSDGLAAAATLAMTGALFHVFNHSIFKSLLFFGAGAVQSATGERNMERLGGLIRAMPRTAFAFLIGAAAISALPPLNGFASEWLVFQAIFLSPQLPQWGLRFLAPATGAVLALSAALAAACFVKAFGITFLGRPRSEAAEHAHEADTASLSAMFGLAAICIIAGAVPGYFTNAIGLVTQSLTAASIPAQSIAAPMAPLSPALESSNGYGGAIVLLCLLLAMGATACLVRLLANRGTRRGAAWDCGFPDLRPETQYTSGSFAQPIRRVYGSVVFRAQEQVTMPRPGDTAPSRYRATLTDVIWESLYVPIALIVGYIADQLNHVQFFTIRRYLSLVFVALVGLLLVLALWP